MQANSGTTERAVAVHDALRTLRISGGEMRCAELAERIVFSRSGLTRLLDHMEGEGWVWRHQDAEDKRGRFVRITEAGRAYSVRRPRGLGRVIEQGREWRASLDGLAARRVFDRVA